MTLADEFLKQANGDPRRALDLACAQIVALVPTVSYGLLRVPPVTPSAPRVAPKEQIEPIT